MPELHLQSTFELIANSTLAALGPASLQQLPTSIHKRQVKAESAL